MSKLAFVFLLCATGPLAGMAWAEDDIDFEAFEASSQALHAADEAAAAQRAAVEALPARLKNASMGDRAGAHIGAAGGCAIELPTADLDALSSLAVAEAILGKPLVEVPLDGKVIARLTLDATRTPEAAEALRKRQHRARYKTQEERQLLSRLRAGTKKINPQAEPVDCRNLRAQVEDLLSNARLDGALAKAEAVGFVVEELGKLQQTDKRAAED
ncbi:MAG TPA: hypothetical protein VLC08_07645 [Chitinolyticbacter sp.]|nr:hypothetical protein [Chitinolyticbacter sp.]